MKILIIEDDCFIGDILEDALSIHHWVVDRALDGEAGLQLIEFQEYDVILLDIGLPKIDGITVCKQLRSQGCQTPILLLTGLDGTEAQIAGLDAGADDYVTKPFDLDVILARVRAVARKGKTASPLLTWETIQVDSVRGEVKCNDTMVHLRAKEFGLLELFLLNPKRIFSRRTILDHLWDCANSSGEETVSTHVKCVRQKLKAAGAADPIETVHGLGYRLRSPQVDTVFPFPPDTALSANPPLGATAQQKAQAVASKVWNQFKVQYLEQIQTLETLVNALKSNGVSEIVSGQQQECQHLAHKLVGSLGMFGLLEASQHARDLEHLMKASSLEQGQIVVAIQKVEWLKEAIAQAQVKLPPKLQPLPAQTTLSTTPAEILIVDDDLLLADRLRIEAIAWKLHVEIATDLTVARQMIAQNPPKVILLDLSFPGEENGLTLVRELEQRSPKIPVVIFTAKEDLRDRVTAARLGVTAFLHKPLPAHEILKSLTDVLNRQSHQPEPDRVLIMDDDPGFLAALSEQLLEHGLQVTTSADPQNFWRDLASCNPEVLILDLEMPEFDGVELCQVVRADPQWQHLKVLFLSAHMEADVITRAYAAGADDYISKTLPAQDLVTQILCRIGRIERIGHHSVMHLPTQRPPTISKENV